MKKEIETPNFSELLLVLQTQIFSTSKVSLKHTHTYTTTHTLPIKRKMGAGGKPEVSLREGESSYSVKIPN